MSWTQPEQVRARWPGTPFDDDVIQAWIDDAETILLRTFPWLQDQNGLMPLDLANVVTLVVSRMVIRGLSTPFGVRQETVGDTSLAYNPPESLYLTDAEVALLEGFGPQVAFTIDQMPHEELAGEPSLVGAWVNRDGYAPGEVDRWAFPPPANPDPVEEWYPSWPNRWGR